MPRGTSAYDAAIIERRLWTPQLVNCDVWFDASDYASLVWDARITTWKDKSPNGRELNQASVSSQPDWEEKGFNNKPSVYFDGSNDIISLSSAVTWTANHSFVWVGQLIETPSASSAFFNADGGNNGPNNFNSGIYWYTTAAGDILQSPSTMNTNANIVSITRSSTNWRFQRNGTSQSIASTKADVSAFLNFGRSFSDYSNMRVSEFFMYPRSLELWDVAKAEGYTALKWNLVNSLDASHSYKNKPPLRDAG